VAAAVAEVLDVWRDAERLLEQLEDGTDERNDALTVACEMRQLYWRLTDGTLPTGYPTLASNGESIERARALLRRHRQKLNH